MDSEGCGSLQESADHCGSGLVQPAKLVKQMLSSVKNTYSIRMPPEFVSHDPVIITSNYMFRFQIMHATSNDAHLTGDTIGSK